MARHPPRPPPTGRGAVVPNATAAAFAERSFLLALDASDPYEYRAFLERCDARTLRELKAVSSAWRWRGSGSARRLDMLRRQQHLVNDRRGGRGSSRRHLAVDPQTSGGGSWHRAVELPGHAAAIVAKLEDSHEWVRIAAVKTLGELEPAVLAPHAAAVAAKLEDSDAIAYAGRRWRRWASWSRRPSRSTRPPSSPSSRTPMVHVRWAALETLGKLEPAALAQHAAAVVAKLEDCRLGVRRAALETLGKLEPAALAQHAAAIVAKLEDSDWACARRR